LDNIQQILVQLLTNWKNDNTTSSNHKNEENNNNEPPNTDHSNEGSSIDAKMIKGIKAQIASLAQRDEVKKRGSPSLPLGMGFSLIFSKVQATNVALI